MLATLLVAGGTFRRMATLRNACFALLAGGLAGGAVLAMPAPGLAREAFAGLVPAMIAVLVLPVAAALPTGDRLGGYERLQAVRPIRSASWALGRLLGGFVAAGLLAVLLLGVAQLLASRVVVPRLVTGTVEGVSGDTWRFALPRGIGGPFDLALTTHLPLVAAADLGIETRRGTSSASQTVTVRPWRRQIVVVPDLSPSRGDLYVTLRPGPGLVIGSSVPALTVGSERLSREQLVLPRHIVMRLAFALLVVLSAACVFHFETACLAGLFVLLLLRTGVSSTMLTTATVLLVMLSIVGTALIRRQALP